MLICCLVALQFFSTNLFAAIDQGWPRIYADGQKKLTLYQPQIDEWKDYKQISFRSAFSLTLSTKEKPIFGVIEVNAPTIVDSESRTVNISDLDYTVRLPEASEKSAGVQNIVLSLLPKKKSLEVSLDRVITYLDPAKSAQRNVEVNLDPPQVFYSSRSAILVIFVGEPVFKPISGTDLMFAVNTNWPVFLDQLNSTYYLLNENSWLSTTDPINGKWSGVNKLPEGFKKLPKDNNWQDIRLKIPGKKALVVPEVFTSYKPAELIITSGAPTFSPIKGTKLMYVTNTEMPVFMYNPDRQYYYLVAGRWFRAKSLNGPWSSATLDLPKEFANIPVDSPMSYVRSSVPGTDEAGDAVLLASIPQTTTINRDQAKLEVAYDGKPVFKDIETTSVQYAVNTPNDVFKVDTAFYSCFQGVWFRSSQPNGPWILADSVPVQIYSIPVSHPKHNVTYVRVYNSSPTTVTTVQTGGYSGQYVSSGLLVFGAGVALGAMMANDHHDYYYYPPPPYFYSYGGAASYHYSSGGYYRHASAYGPYGGAGRSAYYNPHTDTYAARSGSVNAYGAHSQGFVSRDDEWARGGQNVNAKGRTAWAETSDGGKAATYNKRGPGGYGGIAKSDSGDVYAGRNGSVYKHDNNGGIYKREGDDWNRVEKSGNMKASRSSFDRSSLQGQVSHDAYARSRGNNLSTRSGSSGFSGGGRSGGGRRR